MHYSCISGVDSLTIFDGYINKEFIMTMNKKNQHDKLITLCGIQNPSPLMSSGPNLVMLFRTYSQSKGFVANYSFVTSKYLFGSLRGRVG